MSVPTHQPDYATVASLIAILQENNRALCQELMNDADAKAFFGFNGYAQLYLLKYKVTFNEDSDQTTETRPWSSDDWNNIDISDEETPSSKIVKFDRQMIELLNQAVTARFVALVTKSTTIPTNQHKFACQRVAMADGIAAPSVTWKGSLFNKDEMFRKNGWEPVVVPTVFYQTNLNPFYSRTQFCNQVTQVLAQTSWPISEQLDFISYKIQQFNTFMGDVPRQYMVLQIAKHLAIFTGVSHLCETYPLFAALDVPGTLRLFEKSTEHSDVVHCLDRLDLVDIFCISKSQVQKALQNDKDVIM